MPGKQLKVLFVGNSYTSRNQLPQVAFVEVARAAGCEVEVTSITRGGYRLCRFAEPENEHGIRLRQATTGVHYDCAVLQEQSLTPITDEAVFLAGVAAVKALISADRFVLYATWGRNDGSEDLETLGLTRQEMTEKLSAAYNKAGKQYGMRVAEAGKAFLEYSADHDPDDLYDPDKSHPSALGSAIAAKVIFAQVVD